MFYLTIKNPHFSDWIIKTKE